MSKLWLVCWASLATVGAWAQSTEPEPEPPAEPPKHPITGPVFTPTAPTEVTPGKAPKDGFAERFRRAVLDRITLSGSRRISWHSHGVGGDREAFNLSTTYGLGGQAWSDVGNIAVRGDKVLGLFTFDAVIQDSRFTDPQGQRFRLDYEEGPWSFAAGDIQTALVTGNRYAQFSKSVQGAQVGFRTRDFQVQAITSEAKGQARTISLAGTNSAGPYFLQSNQIIRGSERIEIDGELLTFGSDYTIDYDLGAVTFVNRETLESRLVPPTSTIVASYETLGFAGGRGRIAGAAAGWNVGGGRLGVSLMTQTQGGGGRLSTRLEKFAGFGPPGTPYVLQFLPLAGAPIVIRADGILQTEGLDYTFEPDNRSIFYFTRFMPPSAEIDVLYTPRPTSTAEGDRRVLGLGYSRNLGSLGRINLYTAEGRLSDSGGGDRSGWARGADLNLSRGRADFRVGIQSVPAGFVGIETTGFARAEERADLQLDYRPLAGWRTGLTHQNSSITQIRNEADGSVTFLPSRFTLTGASAS
ncbi:MAG: hypothetical protein MH204_12180, partial [Fimbriimonadaceae bacterium]|nr:hypothetical protein [Fimbriimonadaceae bacterium]